MIEWRNGPNGLRRATVLVPGYSCRPCTPDCELHIRKSDYGNNDADWIYAVGDETSALSLTVGSGIMTLHTTRPDGAAPARGNCMFVRPCYTAATTALGADNFFKTYGTLDYDQPESFWLALEAAFRTQVAGLPPPTVPCPTCGGSGHVPKKEE